MMDQEQFWMVPSGEDEKVAFFIEDLDFAFDQEEATTNWMEKVAETENAKLHQVNYIFCSDEYLHQMNVDYLDHDTLTDIITFPYAEPPLLNGDVFISVDRVRENATTYQVPFEVELHRVMIHGLLHLCGYGDKTPEEKQIMTQKEDAALALMPDFLG